MSRILHKLLFLYFDFLRWLNDGGPTHKESRWAMRQFRIMGMYENRNLTVMYLHAWDVSIEDIAVYRTGYTSKSRMSRERVRAMILKGQNQVRRMFL